MTEVSTPPAPLAGMLGRAAAISRFVAAALVAVVCVRFAVAGGEHAFGGPRAPAAGTARSSPPPRVAPAPVRPRPAPSQAVVHAGAPRSIQLGISAGPNRSEIYVNGRLLGHTPFVGDTSCKTGLPLRIELVPPAGPPLVYERECRGGIIEISGPPP